MRYSFSTLGKDVERLRRHPQPENDDKENSRLCGVRLHKDRIIVLIGSSGLGCRHRQGDGGAWRLFKTSLFAGKRATARANACASRAG